MNDDAATNNHTGASHARDDDLAHPRMNQVIDIEEY